MAARDGLILRMDGWQASIDRRLRVGDSYSVSSDDLSAAGSGVTVYVAGKPR